MLAPGTLFHSTHSNIDNWNQILMKNEDCSANPDDNITHVMKSSIPTDSKDNFISIPSTEIKKDSAVLKVYQGIEGWDPFQTIIPIFKKLKNLKNIFHAQLINLYYGPSVVGNRPDLCRGWDVYCFSDFERIIRHDVSLRSVLEIDD